MPNGFLLIGSNDVGLPELDLLEEGGLAIASGEMGYSGSAARKLYDERFQIRVVKLDEAVEYAKARALHSRLDGVALMTCRPYGNGSEIHEPLAEIRAWEDMYLAFPQVPARVVPVVLADIKLAMAGRSGPPVSSDWAASVELAAGSDPHDVARNVETLGDRTYDCLFKLVRSWRLDLMEDLEVASLVIARGPAGELRPRVALRRESGGGRMHLAEFDPRRMLSLTRSP